ncbi:hypothetical protein NQD34_003053 [Periophthalmus magnuspinnatus]|uniref:complement decay-accelerating factor isoform X2 n=1 Tax=Periophthalmus magnuspinnatus TaxID=409849 RepID=UPI0022BAD0FB|nr:complement decay-accelerating factor isoform X2 [Periophthalmus magnuspinnatus]KAJ0023154.1 hypothetical protein NQD34_003053 [Periophthalmus magnuspinnatus]
MDILPCTRAQHWIKPLFLLYLFVAKTLGDCDKPVLEGNIVLTDEALLMNKYPDNVEISLTCANGYLKDSGSATIKCIDGAWHDPDLTCKKKDCGPPPPRPHMTFDTSMGTLFGAVATIICEKGFSVNGTAYKHCYNTGWTGKYTICEVVTCDIPEEISNGKHLWNSTEYPEYGDYIYYLCDGGYRLTGKEAIMCNENGEFDSTPPQCLSVTKADVFTTKIVTAPTSTTTPPTQETSASTTSAGTTRSGPRDSTHTASVSPTVSLSARGEDKFKDADNTTNTIRSTMPHNSQGDQKDDVVDIKKNVGYTPVIISVVCVSLVVCIAVLFIHKLLNKRKGSRHLSVGEHL